MRKQQAELAKRATEISDSVTEVREILNETEENVNQLNNELDDIRKDFQRTFLEFLGFFSAIIAVIVITGQIALEFADPSEAGHLMIVSYGGLLFAFGGFAAILSSE